MGVRACAFRDPLPCIMPLQSSQKQRLHSLQWTVATPSPQPHGGAATGCRLLCFARIAILSTNSSSTGVEQMVPHAGHGNWTPPSPAAPEMAISEESTRALARETEWMQVRSTWKRRDKQESGRESEMRIENENGKKRV